MKIITSQNAPAAIGPYSQAITYGDLIFTSGQIPLDPKTGNVVVGGIAEQSTQSMENVLAILEEAGTDMSKVLKTTCFLADMKDFAQFNEVYSKYFTINKPARSCVAVKDLPRGVLCEVEVIAGLK